MLIAGQRDERGLFHTPVFLSQSLTRTSEVATSSCKVDYENAVFTSGSGVPAENVEKAVSTEDKVQVLRSLVFVGGALFLQLHSNVCSLLIP